MAFADIAFVDDVTYSSVPTPGAGAVLGLGGLRISRRRRSQFNSSRSPYQPVFVVTGAPASSFNRFEREESPPR